MYAKTKSETALMAIRKSICLADGESEQILHETALATEYGMSRTPIRQILQRLSYERLVYTKSGVGTVVVPLLKQDRPRDVLTQRGLLQAITLHQYSKLEMSDHSELITLKNLVESMAFDDTDAHYAVLERLHFLLQKLVPDAILSDALSASHWRIVRWHMQDAMQAPNKAFVSLTSLVTKIASYEPFSANDLAQKVLEAYSRFRDTSYLAEP